MSNITIQQFGITYIPTDAIVNTANSALQEGAGVLYLLLCKNDKLTEKRNTDGPAWKGKERIC